LKRLLIIAHTPSPNTQTLASALLAGAQKADIDVQLRSPFDCDHHEVLASDALILFTTENFGYMSGALKDFFERVYYPCLADTARNDAKPYALVVRAGLDGTGTQIAVSKIISGLKWKEIQPVTLCKGAFQSSFTEQCHALGHTVAMSLEASII
jgi:multimeric flavodoxin WrbA